jgi:hypothetical protein
MKAAKHDGQTALPRITNQGRKVNLWVPTNLPNMEAAASLAQNGHLLCSKGTEVMSGGQKDVALPEGETRSEIPVQPRLRPNQHRDGHDLDRKLQLRALGHGLNQE